MTKKKFLKFVCGILVAFIIFFGVNFVGSAECAGAYFLTEKKLLPIYSVETQENKVSISFDAAWGSDKTEQIMDICDEFNVKATFFLVGFWIEKNQSLTKSILDRGFEIGIHSNTHPDMAKLSEKQIEDELNANQQILFDATQQYATLFRPPFGSYNNTLISVCKNLNLTPIQWSVDSLDWKGLSAENLASRVTKKVKLGDIILFHNNSDNILDGLKIVLQYFKDNNIQNVPVGQLIYKENYKINIQGTQIKL